MKLGRIILFLTIVATLAGCMSVTCTEPDRSYEYWAGEKVPADLKVINGYYWRSPHFTMEFIMHLEVIPTEQWWEQMLEINNFIPDTATWSAPDDAPKWFKPSQECKKWKEVDDFQGSRMLKDTVTGHCYIYFIQL